MMSYWPVVLIALCVLLSGFFSGAETAMISCSRVKIRHLAELGHRGGKVARRLLDNPDKLLATVLVGTNLAVVAGSVLATYLIVHLLGEREAELWATLIMVPVVLVFGEILPKVFFYQWADILAPWVAILLKGSATILAPLVFITAKPAAFLLKLVSEQKLETKSFMGRRELQMLVREGEREGAVDLQEARMIRRIFDFGRTLVRDIMVPLQKVVSIEVNSSIEQAISTITRTGHSRLPVFRGKPSDIVGLVFANDLLDAKQDVPLESLVKPTPVVRETMGIEELLTSMQKGGQHLAIVADKRNVPSGVVTLEDAVEEIVGEIEDEFDRTTDHTVFKR